MSRTGREVAIITGGSQGIGASLVAAYRRQRLERGRHRPHDKADRGP
jgi:NAD(P)-dependent dehydrogenase (short-subunit alcohol dehydrogenase family)